MKKLSKQTKCKILLVTRLTCSGPGKGLAAIAPIGVDPLTSIGCGRWRR